MNGPTKPPAYKTLPYIVEFVKFSAGFACILASSLLILHVANAAQ